MEKILELNHIAPYLPYGLKVSQPRNGKVEAYALYGLKYSEYAKEWTVFIDDSRHGDYQNVYLKGVKPILRPIQYIMSNDFKPNFFVTNEQKEEDYWLLEAIESGHRFAYSDFQNLTYRTIEFLLKNHFDVFGLINDGLAIDINTI